MDRTVDARPLSAISCRKSPVLVSCWHSFRKALQSTVVYKRVLDILPLNGASMIGKWSDPQVSGCGADGTGCVADKSEGPCVENVQIQLVNHVHNAAPSTAAAATAPIGVVSIEVSAEDKVSAETSG